MRHVCPTCGGPVSFDDMIVDLNTNTILFRGQKVEVWPPKLLELIYILRAGWPEMVVHNELVSRLWNAFYEPENSHVAVRVYVSHARKVLRPLGVGIHTFGRRGYRLVLPAASESRAA